MSIKFTKMHGLGNDFVVIEQITQNVDLTTEQIRHLADRHYGIGFDQLLLVSPTERPDADFRYRIYNADGNEVEQCGNGARCFAKFVWDHGLTEKNPIVVQTRCGLIELKGDAGGQITINMGAPALSPTDIPLTTDTRQELYNFTIGTKTQSSDADEHTVQLSAISMGNPHGVLLVENTEVAAVETLGPILENHPNFPNKANIGFMQVIDRNTIRLRVFERGVGETLACGTGACAAAVAAIQRGLADSEVVVHLPGGTLTVQWEGEESPGFMTGPASTVFEGTIDL